MNRQERLELYHSVFDSVEGRRVVEELCRKYHIHTTTYNRNNSEYETVYKEGQRRVILYILNNLKEK